MLTEVVKNKLELLFLDLVREKSNLDPSTPVYRITDFYSVAQMLRTKRLWTTRVSTYADQNEGVDKLVRGLYLSAEGQGCGGFGAHDEFSARQMVQRERACRFVSCWSKNGESQAMWSLYSPDTASVQIQTSVGKLQEVCALALAEQWSQYCFEPRFSIRRSCVATRVSAGQFWPFSPLFVADSGAIGLLSRDKTAVKLIPLPRRVPMENLSLMFIQ